MGEHAAATLNERVIEEVFQGSVEALRSTREQVFQIAESGRDELNRLRVLVEQVKEEARECIQTVDEMEVASRKARLVLANINVDFSSFSDADIREAYAHAERCLVKLSAAREREEALRRRRDDLQRQLKHLQQLLGKADHVVSQVGIALDFLTGNLNKMTEHVGDMRDQAAMAQQIIRAQEEERRRVARDIHDGPAQLLANLVMRVEIMEQMMTSDDDRLRTEVKDMQAVVKDSLQDLRRIIFNLRPMALDDLGLAPAIRGYAEVLREQFSLNAELRLQGNERRLAPAAETALFRVMQEALNNAHRHGHCRHVSIVLEFRPEGVRLSVRDDGQGFDMEQLQAEEGRTQFGLLNMRERMRLLGGTFRISSAPQEGTLVSVSVPWSVAALGSESGEGGLPTNGDSSPDRR